ncbi:2-phospho-L-lactate guanylyltransferase [Actinocorallia populi]|uniref:2-phospho-L-lactate guanylyltransferase n=1 Tax=Actinocorallia populi TaxID=2079200 RepID=UPI001E55D483|nr:2-phospho-L-lactate guanylyltransferase [Actinocorallia populi]
MIVPVKRLELGKSRLAAAAGAYRSELALAVATDTVDAALRCPAVGAVVVVTADPLAAGRLGGLGALVVPEGPAPGLNEALRRGAEHAGPLGLGVAALQADLPALRPAELHAVLAEAELLPRAFLPDRAGIGTVLYSARPGEVFAPAFGGASRARHLALGVPELAPGPVPSVRTDVDTLADLRAALELGVGPHTAAVAERILAALPR